MNQSLSDGLTVAGLIILAVFMWTGMFIMVSKFPQKKTYDCSIAEISPDMPLEAKMECRKLRMIKE